MIARGEGNFQIVVYKGGLPGEGWQRGDGQLSMEGKRHNGVAKLTGDNLAGEIAGGKMTITDADGKQEIKLERTERKSPTLGAEPAEGAVVLFDGSHLDQFPGATLTEMKTLQAGCSSKSKFTMYKLHLEFRLSYKPKARGQGRSNSGVYIGGCPEIQVLDSFGLEGRNNECGALYGRREPDVNMCLPPLVWRLPAVGPKARPARYPPPEPRQQGAVSQYLAAGREVAWRSLPPPAKKDHHPAASPAG